MNASYRPGILVVAGTVLASLLLCLTVAGPAPAPARAGQNLDASPFPLGEFRLLERSGRAFTQADLADRVCVASFIFTRCPLSCPRITSVMKGLQPKFAGTGVTLLSITVDPEYDTPEVLSDYANRFGAGDRWWFVTGPKDTVYNLTRERFKLGVQPSSEADQKAGAEAVEHSDRLALIDHGNVVGYYDSTDPKAVEALVEKAKQKDRVVPPWAKRLPAVNAALNASCAGLLALGWLFARSGRVRWHVTVMAAAVTVSALFLACYLVYHYQAGSVAFQGTGALRYAYLTVLLSHTLLATFGVVPLVTLTLVNALRKRFDRHVRVARLTFPIWMYVSVTGVVIYWMLYQLPIAVPASNLG